MLLLVTSKMKTITGFWFSVYDTLFEVKLVFSYELKKNEFLLKPVIKTFSQENQIRQNRTRSICRWISSYPHFVAAFNNRCGNFFFWHSHQNRINEMNVSSFGFCIQTCAHRRRLDREVNLWFFSLIWKKFKNFFLLLTLGVYMRFWPSVSNFSKWCPKYQIFWGVCMSDFFFVQFFHVFFGFVLNIWTRK